MIRYRVKQGQYCIRAAVELETDVHDRTCQQLPSQQLISSPEVKLRFPHTKEIKVMHFWKDKPAACVGATEYGRTRCFL